MAELRIAGLEKRFGAVEALRGVDLAIEDGEFFAILGASAAGKTTLLRCIAGVERPDAGVVVLGGRELTAVPPQARGVAMVFQTFALYPHLTVFDNLAYPLREARLAEDAIRRRVEETASMLRLTHTLRRGPGTLSGGEQQRCAIGRALIRRPSLLLLDEPLTNLDAKLRHDTRAEFKRLHRELRTTMVYATPDQLEALGMGQRIAVLHEGRIVQVGSPAALYDRPCNDLVAVSVGDPPMNLLPAVLRHGADGPRIELPFLDVPARKWAPQLEPFPAETELWLGVRPHDLAPVASAPCGPHFTASVRLVEPLGDVAILDLAAGGTPLKLVLPEERAVAYAAGQTLELELNLDDTHVFSRETGTIIV